MSVSIQARADVLEARVSPFDGRTYSTLGVPSGGGGFNGQTWQAAEAEAITRGGHLATIVDAASNEWVARNMLDAPSYFSNDAWIGFNDIATEGNFVWADGSPVTYTNWSSNEPNGGTGENAASIGRGGNWNDATQLATPLAVMRSNTSLTRRSWANASGGSYGTAANWSPAAVPTAAHWANFGLSNTYALSFSINQTVALSTFDKGSVTFNLAGRTFTSAETYIGYNAGSPATASFGGGTVNTANFVLGESVGSGGTVRVTAGGLLTASSTFTVGFSGSGVVEVSGGGDLSTSTVTTIGNLPGSGGSVSLTGAGSTWNTTTEINVGTQGTGALLVTGGAGVSVPTGNLFIGRERGSDGTVAVSGAGSTLSHGSGEFRVGNRGIGELSVMAGGAVTSNRRISVGESDFGDGTVIVDGSNSMLSTTDRIDVSAFGSAVGSMQVSNGGKVESNGLIVGFESLGQGTVDIGGLGSRYRQGTGGAGVSVGYRTLGIVNVHSGGEIVSNSSGFGGIGLALGQEASGTGLLTVTGIGSKVSSDRENWIGQAGTASVAVLNGATADLAFLRVGMNPGAFGQIQVAGAGSVLTAGGINVAEFGNALITVSDGGRINVNSALRPGGEVGSTGVVVVDGASSVLAVNGEVEVGRFGYGAMYLQNGAGLTVPGTLYVGSAATGAMTMQGGGTLNISGGLRIGNSAAGNGDLSISGPTAVVTVGNGVAVGADGVGALSVSNGVTLGVSGDFRIGETNSASGQVRFSGPGVAATVSGQTFVGAQSGGDGSLLVEGGAVYNGQNYFSVADGVGSLGALTISGAGSRVNAAGEFRIGFQGQGSMVIDGGGVLSVANQSFIGETPSGIANNVLVTGPGSRWETVNFLVIGRGSVGSVVTVADGGTIAVTRPFGEFHISESSLVMAGGTISCYSLRPFNDNVPLSGHGTINSLFQHNYQRITVSGGTMDVGDATNEFGVAVRGVEGVYVENNATLKLRDSTFAELYGQVTLNGGVISARNGTIFRDGAPLGYGVIVGAYHQPIASPTGTVNLSIPLDVGNLPARIFSIGRADLGPMTTMAGGSLSAPAGVRLGAGDVLSGYGTVIGSVQLAGGVVSASGGSLITSTLTGYGVVVGNVVPGVLTGGPAGTVDLPAGLTVGSSAAKVFSQGSAHLGGTTTIAGGSISAPNGLTLNAGDVVSGFGTVTAPVALAGGALRGAGGTLTATATVSGHGLLLNNVAAATVVPSGTFSVPGVLNLGADTARFISTGEVPVSGTLTMAGGGLAGSRGVLLQPGGSMAGFGTVGVPVAALGGTLAGSGGILTLAGTTTVSGTALNTTGAVSNTGMLWLLGAGPSVSGELLSNAGTIQGDGQISTTGGLTNSGSILLSGSADVLGAVTNTATGSVVATGSGPTTFYGPVANGGTITVTNGSVVVFAGLVSGAGSIGGSGNVVFLGGGGVTAPISVGGTVYVEPGTVMATGDITAGSVSTAASGSLTSGAVDAGVLTVAGYHEIREGSAVSEAHLIVLGTGATLDLRNNDLIVDYTGASVIGELIVVLQSLQLISNGDDGSGLPTFLAVSEAADLGLTDYEGRAVDDSAVILKFTYVGDANLDGQVDALDYERIDLAIGNTGVFGTAQGDINYDGVVDALDYEQVDLNIGNGVGGPLAGVFVPEPACLSVVALGFAGMARRRR